MCATEPSLSALTLRLCLKWCVLLRFTLAGFVTRRRHETALRAVTKSTKIVGNGLGFSMFSRFRRFGMFRRGRMPELNFLNLPNILNLS